MKREHQLNNDNVFTSLLVPNASSFYYIQKRTLDILISLVALMVLLPVFIVFAFLIFCESPSSVFYKQTRVGLKGKEFRLWKFRSMRNGDDLAATTHDLSLSDGVRFKMQDDPRVTRIGKFIRKFSIDELPQLFNVLKGDMSLVGPRPALPEECQRYSSYQRLRLNAKPGVTCIWQVSGRSSIPFNQQVEMDLEYIHRASLLLDLKLLFKTIPAVLSARGAY